MNPAAARPRLATTIMLLRSASQGFEVFMVQRHRRSGFLPNAWVFPGGRLDEADAIEAHPRVSGGAELAARTGLPLSEAVAFAVAGVRETFEEAGIWLGEGTLPDSLRAPMAGGEVPLGQALDDHGARIALDDLHPWSWWVTPVGEPKRYDTRFFVAVADGHEGAHDDRETVDSGWFSPAEIVADYRIDRFPMAPPTWWSLRELAAHDDISSVIASSPGRTRSPIQPIIEFAEGGALRLLLPGHPEHSEPALHGLPTLLRLEGGGWAAEY